MLTITIHKDELFDTLTTDEAVNLVVEMEAYFSTNEFLGKTLIKLLELAKDDDQFWHKYKEILTSIIEE